MACEAKICMILLLLLLCKFRVQNVRNLFYSVFLIIIWQSLLKNNEVFIFVLISRNIFIMLKTREFSETEICLLSEFWCLKMLNQFLTKKNINKTSNTSVRNQQQNSCFQKYNIRRLKHLFLKPDALFFLINKLQCSKIRQHKPNKSYMYNSR